MVKSLSHVVDSWHYTIRRIVDWSCCTKIVSSKIGKNRQKSRAKQRKSVYFDPYSLWLRYFTMDYLKQIIRRKTKPLMNTKNTRDCIKDGRCITNNSEHVQQNIMIRGWSMSTFPKQDTTKNQIKCMSNTNRIKTI